jgi:hypothetical protein
LVVGRAQRGIAASIILICGRFLAFGPDRCGRQAPGNLLTLRSTERIVTQTEQTQIQICIYLRLSDFSSDFGELSRAVATCFAFDSWLSAEAALGSSRLPST